MAYLGPLDCLFRLADPALGWPNHQSTYLIVPNRVGPMTDENTNEYKLRHPIVPYAFSISVLQSLRLVA